MELLSEVRSVVMEGSSRVGRPAGVRLARNARLTRLRAAMPLSGAIAGSICAANPGWLRRLIYPAFAAAAVPGRCSADTTRRIITCLMRWPDWLECAGSVLGHPIRL